MHLVVNFLIMVLSTPSLGRSEEFSALHVGPERRPPDKGTCLDREWNPTHKKCVTLWGLYLAEKEGLGDMNECHTWLPEAQSIRSHFGSPPFEMTSGLSASQPADHPAELKFHGDFISTKPPVSSFLRSKAQNSMEAGQRDVSEMVCLFWTYRICHVKQRCDLAFDHIPGPSIQPAHGALRNPQSEVWHSSGPGQRQLCVMVRLF
jgi:hypothetical protein